MQRMLSFFRRHATSLFFPLALTVYDFSAYLTTDLIQPGIIDVVREFNADISMAPASVSLYMAGGMALQWLLGPLSDRIGRRPVLIAGALIFTLACIATLFTTTMEQFLVARFVQGTSICFIGTVGYATIHEAFDPTRAIKLMAIVTSVVLMAPVIGPISGAALLHFVHWKVLFAIIAVLGLFAFLILLWAMPETVVRGNLPLSVTGVVRDFRNVFRDRIFLSGAVTIALSYIPMMTWVAVSPVILIDAGGLSAAEFAWAQVPVFGGVIVANMVIARFVKDPTSPTYIWRSIPVQLTGLVLLVIGNLLWPHVWIWSVAGTSLYAFGIGLIFPTLCRFTLFSNDLPKGTVSASMNIIIFTGIALSVEGARWLWFYGGRIPFHLLALVAGMVMVVTLAGLLKRVRTHNVSVPVATF
ncbi:multidrug efflux MFS transporter MdtM [Salmonella enterica]|nr:multidrug efflux MFS transporter MdtM [Salmonella enterica]EHM5264041.1 multidrug efflux MFS transporter MdtM [Salmonella enterica]